MKKSVMFMPAILLLGVLAAACSPSVQRQPAAPPTVATSASGASSQAQSPDRKWDELVAQGKKEGKVTVYTSANPATTGAISAAFREKYGINVEFVIAKGNELVTRVLKETQAGIRLADVMAIGASTLIDVKAGGVPLEDMAPFLLLPEVSDAKSWLGNRQPFFDQDRRIVAFQALYTPPGVVNTDLVKLEQIKSYYDLVKPEWKGKIAMGDPTVSGTARTWVAYMLLRGLGKEKGQEFIDRLIKQQPFITRDDRLVVEWVMRGKYSIVIGPYSQTVSELQLAGAPLKWMKMQEGGYITPGGGCLALFKERPSVSAGVVFVNWLLSKEGQALFAKYYGAPSARTDIPVDVIDPNTVAAPGEKVFIADEQFYLETAKITPTIVSLFRPLILQ